MPETIKAVIQRPGEISEIYLHGHEGSNFNE